MAKQSLSRKELYELVWSKPMTTLAKMYGLSDVGLAKICRKLDIPKPYPGYWARKRVGQKPKKLKLPDPEREEEVSFSVLSEAELAAADGEQTQTKATVAAGPPIVIAETLRGAHRLVSLANEQYQGAKSDGAGLLIPPEGVSLRVLVSRASLRRTLLVVDALLKNCEQRGYSVSAGPQVQIGDQRLGFHLSEQLETIREEPDEAGLDGRYEFHHNRFRETRRPTGRLTLHLDDGGAYWASNARHTWRETEKQRIEDRLEAFMAGLITLAARKREYEVAQEQRRRDEAEAERKRQEDAARRAERRKLQKAEKARLEALLSSANNWRDSQNLRAYIEARIEAYNRSRGGITPESKFGEWVDWARQQADRLDPLVPTPPSILDEDLGEDDSSRSASWSWYNR